MEKTKKDEKCQSFILVGTYRGKQLENWGGYYNYPITDADKIELSQCAQIKELWLFLGTKKQVTYKAKFIGIKTRKELLDDYGYPGSPRAHSDKYFLFETTSANAPTEDESWKVIVRVSDFVKDSPSVAKRLKEYLESSDRTCKKSIAELPKFLCAQAPERLCVSQDSIQLDFFARLMTPHGFKMKKQSVKHSFIDLFAGCGGLSLGLEQAGFTPLLVNELNSDAMGTYLLNRRDVFPWLCSNNVSNVKDLVLHDEILDGFQKSIKEYFGIDIYNGELDLICGGPPCQGFSGLGIRRSYSVEKKQLPSNYLYQDMAFLVNKIRPKIFLFENVRGLLSAKWTNDGKKGEIFEDVLKTFNEIDAYHVRHKLVYAKDYGVPQNRPRVLIVGLRKDIFDEPKNYSDAVDAGLLPKRVGGCPTIEELISDLINPEYERGRADAVYLSEPESKIQREFRTCSDGTLLKKGALLSEQEYSGHSDFIVEKFRAMIENGGVIPDKFKTKKFAQKVLPRVWDSKGPTITACSAPDDYVHFSQPRSLTVREWARLQTFPDWYKFVGKLTTGGLRRAGNPREGIFERELPKYTQIGNAVPVKLAYNIGLHFSHLLEGAAHA